MKQLLVIWAAVACRREPAIEEPVPLVMHPRTERPSPIEPDAGAPVVVDIEVTARIVDAKPDKAAGTTIVTVGAGRDRGIEPEWIGEVIDERDQPLGSFTIVEVKARTTIGASGLAPKQLAGKRVRLASPPREP